MSQPKTKQSSGTTPSKTRDPPPALFLHPSPAASALSLPSQVHPGQAHPGSTAQHLPTLQPTATLSRQSSLLNPLADRSRGGVGAGGAGASAGLSRQTTDVSSRTADRTDALWAEMQATLEEVELSATGGTHVFGPQHDRKLAELRNAQIALAQAWARSEADDAKEAANNGTGGGSGGEDVVSGIKGALGNVGLAGGAVAGAGATTNTTAAAAGLGGSGGGGGGTQASSGAAGKAAAEGTVSGKSIAGTGSARPPSSGGGGAFGGPTLEEETEVDILLARQRREANDRYFSKVDLGVQDVVAKLEEVAVAMRAVEQETRDVWGEESVADSTKA